ncbi:salicylic acid-binding protein 2-like [Triticum dicoccoides]|uniref:salicylic acid-binding protein 2-like n=1 Tax=Triticum dicoccoides TaxID=85692 RepID=UPI00188F9273|nr:salicylic acid-binding protein 2-like [Triticum dicoccoides]
MSSSSSSAPAAAVATSTRLILVHGTGHGGWCWYKVATLLRAAGHRVDAPDLAACGADARRLSDAPTFEDYTRPLLDALRALPDGERAVLVGHSFGGMSLALAAEEFPDKVAAAVFLTAFMPDCAGPRTRVIEQVPVSDWMDSVVDEEHVPPSVFLGPDFVRRKLYQLTSEEDYTLCQSLARVSSYYVADQQQRPPFSAARYGAVTKVYVIAKQDQAMVEEYQRQMIAGIPVAEVREMADADHMAMLSAPEELAGHLADIANNYT